MKIALVSPYDYMYPSGVNHHVFCLGDNFTRMGHEVKYVLPSSKPEQLPINHTVIFVGRPIPIHTSGSIARSPVSPKLFFSRRIPEILEEEKFDIVHLHEPLCPPLTTACLRYSCTVNIGTFHAFRARSWGYWFWRPALNRWAAKLHGRIAVSHLAREFISHYFPGKYTIIPNGIDWQRFATPQPPFEELSDGKINILFVGRQEKRKGFDCLIEAYRHVKQQNPHTRLIAIGPQGWGRWKYNLAIRKYGLKDVVFTGHVSWSDLTRYYHTADICCAPAISSESFGIVLLEAMAAGKPVVASNIEGYASVASQNVDSLLVRPKDAKALATTINLLVKDKLLRERLGASGQLKAQQFSWDRIARSVLGYYEEVLDRPRHKITK